MAIVVLKFGGTSVADLERIENVARHVKREVDAGHKCAVVVSAMAGVTNQLVDWCQEAAGGQPDPAEYDAVVASGEQVTSGLLALTLQKMGIKARSWHGWQVPIETCGTHSKGRIAAIDSSAFNKAVLGGEVAVVAGFQGVTPNKRISTLGRGGSDTSAVGVAAALKADRCDIYTDVDGVYTTDPRIVKKARRLEKISYEEMLEMASLGAKVLQTRSAELAMAHQVRLQVRSSFDDPDKVPAIAPDGTGGAGTLVCSEDEIVEQQTVSGIAYAKDEAKVTLIGIPDKPGVAGDVFGPLSEANINVDMIVQNISPDGKMTDLTFTVPVSDLTNAMKVLEGEKANLCYQKLAGDENVVKVSIIGVGMRSHAGVAAKTFKALAEKKINIQAITTSEIKISVLINSDFTELAVRTLHTLFELDSDQG